MRFEAFSFGSIRIDGITYEHDVVIDRGDVRKRKKKPVQKIPGQVRAYAAVHRREDPMEVPPPDHRHGHGRTASDG